jgi:hypothetical protein
VAKQRIAIDLDDTLGSPMVGERSVVGFSLRPGAQELLQRLSQRYHLVLWSVGNRSYVNKTLSSGLNKFFHESVSWDDHNEPWKDIRKLRVTHLIEANDHHAAIAKKYGVDTGYIIVPAFGSEEDDEDPYAWKNVVEEILLPGMPQGQPQGPIPPQQAPTPSVVHHNGHQGGYNGNNNGGGFNNGQGNGQGNGQFGGDGGQGGFKKRKRFRRFRRHQRQGGPPNGNGGGNMGGPGPGNGGGGGGGGEAG